MWEHLAPAALRLSTTQPHHSAERLQAANEAWSAWAEKECDYWAWEEGGGVGEQVGRVRCHARVTADRAITLIVAAAAP